LRLPTGRQACGKFIQPPAGLVPAINLSNIIKKSGLKLTNNRLAVLDYLRKLAKPITAEVLSSSLKLNIVTVYRTLESFVSKGLIYQTDFRQGKSFFEFQETDHHHHHVVCTKCGVRESLDFCIGDKLTQEAQKRSSVHRQSPRINRTNYSIKEKFSCFKSCRNCCRRWYCRKSF
jgi:Fe2+ or Zn2+ uptake regulation protein